MDTGGDMSDIRIVCGDPEKGPASFTRFVLPFAYKLEKLEGTSPEHYYQPITLSEPDSEKMDIWRRRYFTDETEEVLFSRAKWFRSETPSKDVDLPCNDNVKRKAVICPPMLVLFEFPDDPSKSVDFSEILHTGMLIQEVCFHKDTEATFEDLLKLNELFRYWQKPYDGHDGQKMNVNTGKIELEPTDYTRLVGQVLEPPINEFKSPDSPIDFYFDRWASLLKQPVRIGDKYWKVVTEKNMDDARQKATGRYLSSSDWQGDPGWLIHADNRAFVWSCTLLENGGSSLREDENRQSEPLKACDYWRWIRLLNVDSPGWGEASEFERKWAEERTYTRWEHMGTFYGYSYHSGVMLAPPTTNPELWKNFGAMYFDQMLLLLYLRTTLFKFSVALNKISSEAIKSHDNDQENWGESFQKLRWSFSLFANLYQFPLLSNQQQGLEMYSLQRKQMEVDDLFREMKEEIHSSYEFLMVKQDREQTEQGARLNVVATLGVVGALAFGFLGINILVGENKASWLDFNQWMIVLFVVFVFWCITTLIVFYSSGLSKFFSKLASYGQKES